MQDKNTLLNERVIHLKGVIDKWSIDKSNMTSHRTESSLNIGSAIISEDYITNNALQLKINHLEQQLHDQTSEREQMIEKLEAMKGLVQELRKIERDLKHRSMEQLQRVKQEMENIHLLEIKDLKISFEEEKKAIAMEMQKVTNAVLEEDKLPELARDVNTRRQLIKSLLSPSSPSSNSSVSPKEQPRKNRSNFVRATKPTSKPKESSLLTTISSSSSSEDANDESTPSTSTNIEEESESQPNEESFESVGQPSHTLPTNTATNASQDITLNNNPNSGSGISRVFNSQDLNKTDVRNEREVEGGNMSHLTVEDLQHLLSVQQARTEDARRQISELEQILDTQREAFMRHLSLERHITDASKGFSVHSTPQGIHIPNNLADPSLMSTTSRSSSRYDQTGFGSMDQADEVNCSSRSSGDISLPLPPSYIAIQREVYMINRIYKLVLSI